MIAESLRKSILALEITALLRTLRESTGTITDPDDGFSQASLMGLSLDELASIKDDLRDAVRSLGGGRNGR